MLTTIRHNDIGPLVVVAKCLTGYIKTNSKISDADSYIKVNGIYDADYVAFVVSWQTAHGCTADGIIGPDTWTAISKAAPTCSTSKNKTSGYTFALQLLLGGNLTADAIYGNRTKNAVAVYQDAMHLDADGICGPKTWSAIIVGAQPAPGPTPEPTFKQPVDYKQGDPRWGKKMYSNHGDKNQTMANSGCGPTADADVVASLKDKSVDPWTIAQQSMEWGDRTYDEGTKWTLFKPHTEEYYNFSKVVKSANYEAFRACVDAGGYAVCSMKSGYWTPKGHFICGWKYDDKYTYANDPASKDRTLQKTSAFKSECRQYFCFYPDPKPEDGERSTPSLTKVGDAICDVSKFQGEINWRTLAQEVAFVIIKASGLYKNGTDPYYIRNVAGAVEYNIPFHAYSFLYCKTEDEARRDARLFYDSVMAGGHMPLYWVLDCEAEWGVSDKNAPRIAGVFEDELRRLAGQEIKVAIYVANQKYNDWAFDYSRFAYVWIPKYTKDPPNHPCDMWQYASTGALPGIPGRVDLNRLMGTKPLSFFTGGVD